MASSTPLKHPVVLIHGLGARSTYGPFDYFYGVPAALRKEGYEVFIPSLTAWQSVEFRSEQLKEQIEDAIPEGKMNLIGHSMGGLDARYIVSQLGFAERVASVTTIGTPNRGSILGDIAVSLVPEVAFQKLDQALKFFKSSSEGFKQLSCRYNSEKLTPLLADQPGVAYFSATSAIPKDDYKRTALPVFWATHLMLQAQEGDNDGFVSVESSKWGKHICTYRGDHYGQIGQILGRSRGLDHHAFMQEILGHLRKEGF
jgi:triacylglycerol lipase